eukprot:455310_1
MVIMVFMVMRGSFKYTISFLLIFTVISNLYLLNNLETNTIQLDLFDRNIKTDNVQNKEIAVTNYRRAIVFYQPLTEKFINIFTHFFLNSWLYMLKVQKKYRSKYEFNFTNIIDVIVVIPYNYSHLNNIHKMPMQCHMYSDVNKSYVLQSDRSESLCLMLLNQNSLHKDKNYVHILQESYAFLNSIDCIVSFEEQYSNLYYSYNYVLRSDDDVFVTPFFMYHFPANSTEFITGEGAYTYEPVTKLAILNISHILGLKHCIHADKCFNIGSTWYGSPELILKVAKRTIEVNKYLVYLFDNDLTNIGLTAEYMENPLEGFYKGVSLLYSTDIAINHEIISDNRITFRTYKYDKDYILLDFESSKKTYINGDWYGNRVVHIHVWHGDEEDWFSKGDSGVEWNVTMGKYIGDFTTFINMSRYYAIEIREFCTAIAFDLHMNLSVDLFDVDKLLLEKQIIPSVINTREPFLFRNDIHVTDWW